MRETEEFEFEQLELNNGTYISAEGEVEWEEQDVWYGADLDGNRGEQQTIITEVRFPNVWVNVTFPIREIRWIPITKLRPANQKRILREVERQWLRNRS